MFNYSKTCLKQSLKRGPKIAFKALLLLNAGQKYCRMCQVSYLQYFWPALSYHLTFVLSIFEWPLKPGFIVNDYENYQNFMHKNPLFESTLD